MNEKKATQNTQPRQDRTAHRAQRRTDRANGFTQKNNAADLHRNTGNRHSNRLHRVSNGERMKIVHKPIGKLCAYKKNSRIHSDAQIEQIAKSIKEFGFTNPILINEKDVVIAGHGRLEAAQSLEMDKVPCVVLCGLTEAQQRAYLIADNQIALNASWDFDVLKLEITELSETDYDVDLLGVDLEQLFPEFSAGSEDDQGSLGDLEPKMIECPHCKQKFNAREM